MIVILFYYEILEFNFLGLNKNTAKSIQMMKETMKIQEIL